LRRGNGNCAVRHWAPKEKGSEAVPE
jgi:hypothetical protein